MKTKIIGMLAIVIAVGASAFTVPKHVVKNKTSYYWFGISDGILPGHKVPAANATFLSSGTTAPDEGCSGATYQCVSGFTSNQVINGDQLKDDQETPAAAGGEQN